MINTALNKGYLIKVTEAKEAGIKQYLNDIF